jgi:hypothetical protein
MSRRPTTELVGFHLELCELEVSDDPVETPFVAVGVPVDHCKRTSRLD